MPFIAIFRVYLDLLWFLHIIYRLASRSPKSCVFCRFWTILKMLYNRIFKRLSKKYTSSQKSLQRKNLRLSKKSQVERVIIRKIYKIQNRHILYHFRPFIHITINIFDTLYDWLHMPYIAKIVHFWTILDDFRTIWRETNVWA